MAACEAPSLCLVPTRVLLHQWRSELARHYRGELGCLGDGERRIEHVTVATFESAYRWMPELGHRFGQLIVDEVHHFGSGMRDEALEMCAAPLRLGLTATAPSGPQLARLSDLLGPVVFQLTAGDLTGEWLADFDVAALRLPLNDDERARYDQAVAVFRPVHRASSVLSERSWRDFVSTRPLRPVRAALDPWSSRRITPTPKLRLGLRGSARSTAEALALFPAGQRYGVYRARDISVCRPRIVRAERDQAVGPFVRARARAVSALVLNAGLCPRGDSRYRGWHARQREHGNAWSSSTVGG